MFVSVACSLSGYTSVFLDCTILFVTLQILEFGVLLSGITTSILALELSPNSLFHFFRNTLLSILPGA